jgi:hypothetical protein
MGYTANSRRSHSRYCDNDMLGMQQLPPLNYDRELEPCTLPCLIPPFDSLLQFAKQLENAL